MNDFRYLTYTIVLTVLGFGLWIGLRDQQAIFNSIAHVGFTGFAFLCTLSIVNYLLRYVRWRFLFATLGDKTPVMDGLLCYFSGFALTTTPGKAGEAIRCLYFKQRHNVNNTHTFATLLSERTSDALAGVLLASAAFYTFEDDRIRLMGIAVVLLVVSIIVFINQPRLLTSIASIFRVIKLGIVQKALDYLPVFIERSATLLKVKPLLGGSILGFISWSAEAYAFAWLAQYLGGTAPITVYMSIFAISMIAGAISFLPGGLGSADVVMYLLLVTTGLSDADAITATLLCRLATLWFAVILGLLAILWLGNTSKLSTDT